MHKPKSASTDINNSKSIGQINHEFIQRTKWVYCCGIFVFLLFLTTISYELSFRCLCKIQRVKSLFTSIISTHVRPREQQKKKCFTISFVTLNRGFSSSFFFAIFPAVISAKNFSKLIYICKFVLRLFRKKISIRPRFSQFSFFFR